MERERLDPENSLRTPKEAQTHVDRPRLKIFFGGAPGVGKTYAMLEEAQSLLCDGVDIAVGFVEAHGQPETLALLAGLDSIPRKRVIHRGVEAEAFDLDAAIRRKPAILLLDDLSHVNLQGSRHPKRWQDVQALLDAGIGVYTTLNVQHLESLRDVAASITGVRVLETVPDEFLDRADEFELIDVPAELLQERLQEGKVHVPEQLRHATQRFFAKSSLLALRELALRRTVDQVGEDIRRTSAGANPVPTSAATPKIMVLVDGSPASTSLIWATSRMAKALGASWLAVYMDMGKHLLYSKTEEESLREHLRLTERLGGEAVQIFPSGLSAAKEFAALARARRVTRIVVGQEKTPSWLSRLLGTFQDELIRESHGIELLLFPMDSAPKTSTQWGFAPPTWMGLQRIVLAMLAVALATGISHVLHGTLDLADLVMVYMLCIAIVATFSGFWAALAASLLSVLSLDFFFVPPRLSFAVQDVRHVVTFAIMLGVGWIVANLAERIRSQARIAMEREQHTGAQNRLGALLAEGGSTSAIQERAEAHLQQELGCGVMIMLPDAEGMLQPRPGRTPLNQASQEAAQWAFAHVTPAGLGTDDLPGAPACCFPMNNLGKTTGVIALSPMGKHPLPDIGQHGLLAAFASQLSLAIERARLAELRANV